MSRATLLASLAFLAFISLGLPDGLLGVSWPSISRGFDVALDNLGLVAAATTAGYLTSSFLGGAILRHVSLGMVLAASTLAAALALLGFAAAPAFPPLLVLGVLAGLGGGAVDAGLNAYGARHFSARTLNWLHAFFGLGTTLGPLIVTGVLSAGLSWRLSYVIVGVAQLALAATFLATRARWAEDPEAIAAAEEAAPDMPDASTWATLRRPSVWLGMGLFFFYSGIEMATAQWSYSLMTLERGIDPTRAGVFVTLYWGSLMVGRVLFGLIADRVPLVPVLRGCMILALLGALLFWLQPTPALALAGLMGIGFFLAPIFASLVAMTPERVGRAHADSAIGFQIASAGLGGAVLVALTGWATRIWGLGVIGIAIVLFAALLWAFYEGFIRRTARRMNLSDPA
ncbi:MFS transporter [Pseudoroseicyclus aestuarii]|uniref:Fucose permease n=1 Tax=Pseudoroseicyclus aestuarii TaxID=1795041 RepID=A0A318SUB7_9RHOB|nr:MFS transporter [Pseudoroseicyclus aestuarii]PYE85490.1 fucose permease [Pseudoroseicyclus aestuarii]